MRRKQYLFIFLLQFFVFICTIFLLKRKIRKKHKIQNLKKKKKNQKTWKRKILEKFWPQCLSGTSEQSHDSSQMRLSSRVASGKQYTILCTFSYEILLQISQKREILIKKLFLYQTIGRLALF